MPATLKETAEREAREAEEEFEAMGGDPPNHPEADDAPDEEDQEEDRKAAEAEEDGGDVQLQTTSEPGEQGIATQEEDEAPEYTPPDPTDEEVKTATAALVELKNRVRDYGPERTIEALVAIVDIEPSLRTPENWPGEEDEEYHEAPLVGLLATLLIKGCPKLKISPRDIIPVWRNKEKWTSKGVTVRANTHGLSTRMQFLTEGKRAVVEVNYHHFKHLNPLQKVFTCYHALRELDGQGKSLAPDFTGYLDELEVFGPMVFREYVRLANAVSRGKDRELPHQLSLLDEGDGEAAAA